MSSPFRPDLLLCIFAGVSTEIGAFSSSKRAAFGQFCFHRLATAFALQVKPAIHEPSSTNDRGRVSHQIRVDVVPCVTSLKHPRCHYGTVFPKPVIKGRLFSQAESIFNREGVEYSTRKERAPLRCVQGCRTVPIELLTARQRTQAYPFGPQRPRPVQWRVLVSLSTQICGRSPSVRCEFVHVEMRSGLLQGTGGRSEACPTSS